MSEARASRRRHLPVAGACLVLAAAPGRLFSATEALVPAPVPPRDAPAPAASLPIPDIASDREALLPPRLAPSAETGAEARTLYALATRREIDENAAAALPLYRQVLTKDPHFVDLYLKVSLDYLAQRQPDEAEKVLRTGIAANPGSADLLAGLAYLKQASAKLPEAFELAQKAKALAPANILAHRIAFESLRDQGKTDAAIDLARAAARIANAQPDQWAALAKLYTELVCATGQLSRPQTAAVILPLYDKAFALGEPGPDLLRQRGDFSLFLDRKEEAYEFLKKANATADPSAALLLRLANLASDVGKPEEALAYYEQAYALEPDFPQLREVLALQYVQAHRDEKAISLLEETVRRNPTRAEFYSSLGDLYAQTGQLEKAEFNYRQTIALAGKQAQASDYLKLTVVLLRGNRLADAETLLHEAAGRFPDAARIAFFQGIVQRELKRPGKALDAFAQARLLAKDKDDDFLSADFYYELSLAQEQAGQADSSENSLKLGLAIEPNNENLLNALAYFWAEAGKNLPEAVKYSERSLEAAPERGEFVDTLGWIYYRMGKYEKAASLLQRAVALTKEDPVVLGHLADTYLRLGRKDDAGQTLHKLVDKDPANAEARRKLENFLSGTDVASTKNVPKP